MSPQPGTPAFRARSASCSVNARADAASARDCENGEKLQEADEDEEDEEEEEEEDDGEEEEEEDGDEDAGERRRRMDAMVCDEGGRTSPGRRPKTHADPATSPANKHEAKTRARSARP